MIQHHPKIVTNGLVLNIDPANPKSYPAKDDPYVGNVSLLLPFDGANNSTTFTDFSINNLTITVNGDTKISNAQSKFGGTSGYFDGNGDSLTVTNATLFDFSGDFTVEGWFYFSQVNQYNGATVFIAMDVLNSFQFATEGNNIRLRFNGSLLIDYAYTASNLLNKWTHLALTRNGSAVTLWLNGTSVATASSSASINVSALWIGQQVNNSVFYHYFNGYIDDLRITKAARYTSNFTPPDRLTALPGRIYDLTTNKGTGSFVGSGVSYSSTSAGIITLDGSNGYGILPNSLSVGPTSIMSICVWVNYISRPTSTPARRAVFEQSVNTNDFEPILGFPYNYSSSQMSLEIGKAGLTQQTIYSLSTNNLNQWYYLTALLKNGSADFYINGVYQGSVTYNATINSATANTKNWGIGGVFYNGTITSPYANCRVGPIQVYNRNLTTSEIIQNYNAAKGRFGY